MIFMYVVFAPLLITLVCGTFLYIWSHGKRSALGKGVGSVVAFLACILLVLQVWYMSKTWREGRVIKNEMQKMMRQMPETTPQKK